MEGRGVNATALESDIGTVNGVIHVIDRFLGIPYQTIAEKMRADPILSHSWSLSIYTRLSALLAQEHPNKKFTFLVPTNTAWEKARRDFTQIFNSLEDINNPEFVRNQKHYLILSDI